MKAGEINLGGKAAGYAYISKNAVALHHKSFSPILQDESTYISKDAVNRTLRLQDVVVLFAITIAYMSKNAVHLNKIRCCTQGLFGTAYRVMMAVFPWWGTDPWYRSQSFSLLLLWGSYLCIFAFFVGLGVDFISPALDYYLWLDHTSSVFHAEYCKALSVQSVVGFSISVAL